MESADQKEERETPEKMLEKQRDVCLLPIPRCPPTPRHRVLERGLSGQSLTGPSRGNGSSYLEVRNSDNETWARS